MKNQKEMIEALLAGDVLTGIDDKGHNEYWMDKKSGRLYYRNTKENTAPSLCNGIPNFDRVQIKLLTFNNHEEMLIALIEGKILKHRIKLDLLKLVNGNLIISYYDSFKSPKSMSDVFVKLNPKHWIIDHANS